MDSADGNLIARPNLYVSDRPPQKPKRNWKTALGAGAVAVLAKLKTLLIALKALSFGKILLSAGSMFVMIMFEAKRSGWLFGVGFVVLLLVHELGHGWAIKRAGLAAGMPIFIPFFGAMISLKDQPRSSLQEAEIAYGGPFIGTAASIVCAAIYFGTHARIWLSLAYVGFFLNLFNLVPIRPLDGGRIAQVFSRRAWILGLVLLGGMFFFAHTPQLLIIGLFCLMHAFRRGGNQPGPDEASVTVAQRREMAVSYFGLCGFLALGCYFAHDMLGRL